MIPFNIPFVDDKEELYMIDSLKQGNIHGDGYYTKLVNDFMKNKFKTKTSFMTTSCSSALDMSAILINLGEGDEVILPSYTFVSTANAIALRGAKPVFIDICEDTLNLSVDEIESKITDKTKAIYVVHYAGISCDMDRIMEIATRNKLKVVEDAAQAVNSKYKDKYLGTIGDIGCYSFHDTKNYTSGEGGALLVNFDDELANRAEIIREKGTNRNQFIRGQVDKYTWVDIGSSFLPSDILAAILYAQFEKLDEINEKRKSIYTTYYSGLKDLEDKGILKLPIIPDYNQPNYHMFYILLNSEKHRNYTMRKLKEEGIETAFHYVPLHVSPMGEGYGYKHGEFPRTESLSSRLLRLPMYAGLKDDDVHFIIERIHAVLKEYRKKS